jgi:hypothetical protein
MLPVATCAAADIISGWVRNQVIRLSVARPFEPLAQYDMEIKVLGLLDHTACWACSMHGCSLGRRSSPSGCGWVGKPFDLIKDAKL